MQLLYYLKIPVIIFVAGSMIRIIGAMLKIMHWAAANVVLFIGTSIMVLGLLFLMIKLLAIKKERQLP